MQDIEIKWINNDNIKPPQHRGIVTSALGTSSEYTTPLSQKWDTYIYNVQYTTSQSGLVQNFICTLTTQIVSPGNYEQSKVYQRSKVLNNKKIKLRVSFLCGLFLPYKNEASKNIEHIVAGYGSVNIYSQPYLEITVRH